MSNRVSAQIEQVETHLEAIRTHLPKVRELAEEKGNELVEESLRILDLCLSSLDTALSESRLAALPVSSITQVAKQTKTVADVTANTVGNFDGHAGDLTNQVDSLHNRLWLDRLIDPDAEVSAHRSAVGELAASMTTRTCDFSGFSASKSSVASKRLNLPVTWERPPRIGTENPTVE